MSLSNITRYVSFFNIGTSGKKLQSRVSIRFRSVALERRDTQQPTCYWQWRIASKSSWAPSVLIRGVVRPCSLASGSVTEDITKRSARWYRRYPTPRNMPSNPRNHQYPFVPAAENSAISTLLVRPIPANPLGALKCFTLQNQCRHIRATLCLFPSLRVERSTTSFFR